MAKLTPGPDHVPTDSEVSSAAIREGVAYVRLSRETRQVLWQQEQLQRAFLATPLTDDMLPNVPSPEFYLAIECEEDAKFDAMHDVWLERSELTGPQ